MHPSPIADTWGPVEPSCRMIKAVPPSRLDRPPTDVALGSKKCCANRDPSTIDQAPLPSPVASPQVHPLARGVTVARLTLDYLRSGAMLTSGNAGRVRPKRAMLVVAESPLGVSSLSLLFLQNIRHRAGGSAGGAVDLPAGLRVRRLGGVYLAGMDRGDSGFWALAAARS
jgi:hypothetical protein